MSAATQNIHVKANTKNTQKHRPMLVVLVYL